MSDLGWDENRRIGIHGSRGPTVILLHGGPGAPGGGMGAIARELSGLFRVLEPWQRRSGETPLTVARHVADLHGLVRSRCAGEKPALVGTSWGAMLALAYAADHPESAGPLVLVGCGTFDKAACSQIQKTTEERMDDTLRERLAILEKTIHDPGERMQKRHEFLGSVETYEPIDPDPLDGLENSLGGPQEPFDMRAFEETWNDMVRLQEEGVYPEAFEAIESPVIMLHGTYDPHPGDMIHASLQPHIPHIEYHRLDRCGHSPWIEKHAREKFSAILREWLSRHLIRSDRQRPQGIL